jgi:hypothetical protein
VSPLFFMHPKRLYACPVEPFPNREFWFRIEGRKNPKVPLFHISYALALPREDVKAQYTIILEKTSRSVPVNCGDTNGFVYVSDLRNLFSVVCPKWSSADLEKAMSCFDRDRLHLTNQGAVGQRLLIDSPNEDEEEVSSDPPATTRKRKQPSPQHLDIDVPVPVDWQDAFRREMRSYMGINAIAAYRTQKTYKEACDAALVEDVTDQDKESMRARVKEKLWADLYPAIKERTKQEMLALYYSHPEWEARLQQQVAFRAVSKEGGGWSVE